MGLLRRTALAAALSAACLVALSLTLLTALAGPPGPAAAARERWQAAGLQSYRIAVRVEYRSEVCLQQLEVRAGEAVRVLHNTCEQAWLGPLTVPQLFDLAEQVESIPPVRCYPSQRWCICQRTFSARQIDYDPTLGYPTLVMSRSQVGPGWTGVDFWERLLATHQLPNCGPSPRRLTFDVLSVTPLPEAGGGG
jgi:hypothetical protein